MDIFYPVQIFANAITYSFLPLRRKTILGDSVNFFIYDSVKILILLFVVIFVVSLIRSYLPPEKIKKLLTNRFEFIGNILAALIGIITPFCTCSAVPLFIGLVESGVPLGVTFSYLISAPMVNEVAAILLLGLFGPAIAALYIISGVTIAVIIGFIMGKMRLESLVEDYVWKIKIGKTIIDTKISFNDRFLQAYSYTISLIKKVYPYVLIGVGAGALIHGYAPENLLTQIAGKNNPLAVPFAVLIGVPLYSNAAGTIPIVKSLIEKGLPVGTSLAFMMAVTALSFPEMIILRKVLKRKLLAIYFGILTIGIIFTGYLFNAVL
ncbi:permease [Patescibacteria group bacterium]|nr:permease [Patescibacteria group bacterium]MCL5798346.1 permease [Patescibacteria group bacterium]